MVLNGFFIFRMTFFRMTSVRKSLFNCFLAELLDVLFECYARGRAVQRKTELSVGNTHVSQTILYIYKTLFSPNIFLRGPLLVVTKTINDSSMNESTFLFPSSD